MPHSESQPASSTRRSTWLHENANRASQKSSRTLRLGILVGMLSLSARRITSASHQENQSQEGRQYVLSVRTNRRRGGSIYSA
eukprot:4184860-Pyramimonas_sp.AAC.1